MSERHKHVRRFIGQVRDERVLARRARWDELVEVVELIGLLVAVGAVLGLPRIVQVLVR